MTHEHCTVNSYMSIWRAQWCSNVCREEKLIIQRQRLTYQHKIPPLNKVAELDVQAETIGI